jgi:hypothetical protein
MKITISALLVASAMVAGISVAKAQSADDAVVPRAVVVPEDVILQRGFSELIELPGAIENVAVGDPEIVDAAPITSNTFLLNAIAVGTTNILVLDPEGVLLYRARVHVRPVQIWPGYAVKVTYGTGLSHSYVCDPDSGCPPRPPRPPAALPPVINLYQGPTTVNETATAGQTGGGQAAPPSAPSSQ